MVNKSITPRMPIKMAAPKPDPKEQMKTFLAQRKQAYAESVFVAFCHSANNDWDAKAAARKAVEAADALLEELFIKPMEEAAKENKTK